MDIKITRGIISISGEERKNFLQGLITNDINLLEKGRALYAAFLTPQGKYLHDFFIFEVGEKIFIEVELEKLSDLLKRLSLYKLRSAVQIEDVSDHYDVFSATTAESFKTYDLSQVPGDIKISEGIISYVDPRHLEMGVRVVLKKPHTQTCSDDFSFYNTRRILLGIPDSLQDLTTDKSILLECGFDELNAISWEKGCYLGQELTARTKYRGIVRKRICIIKSEKDLPNKDTPLLQKEKEVGKMLSHEGSVGLALVKLDALKNEENITVEDTAVNVSLPAWAVLQQVE